VSGICREKGAGGWGEGSRVVGGMSDESPMRELNGFTSLRQWVAPRVESSR
jgi:hypothetical protein